MKKIYMVEDELSLNVLLRKYLERENYSVTCFDNGRKAYEKIDDMPDLWILDIMLPDMDGYELIKSIKNKNKNTPVIFMSARNEELDRVVGLELGSDDYLSKPFLPRELVIRVNRLMHRICGEVNEDGSVIVGEYEISKASRSVFVDDMEITLTNNEFELLEYFCENKNSALSREQILNKVWGINYFGSDRVVDDTVRRLRKKLNRLSLETVYGYGYKLSSKQR